MSQKFLPSLLPPSAIRDPRSSPWNTRRQAGPWVGEEANLWRSLARVLRLLRALSSSGSPHILWYSAVPEHRELVFLCAEQSGQTALWGPWPGGLCSNWEQVSGSLQAHRRALPWRRPGQWTIPRLERLHRRWQGWRPQGDRPDLVIALHPRGTEVLRREAQSSLIPTVGWGFGDSTSLKDYPWTYPLCGNPDSLPQVYAVARLLACRLPLE